MSYVYDLCLWLKNMPCMYAFTCMPYMHALHARRTCTPYMHALYVCLLTNVASFSGLSFTSCTEKSPPLSQVCIPYMSAYYVRFTCMYGSASFVFILFMSRPRLFRRFATLCVCLWSTFCVYVWWCISQHHTSLADLYACMHIHVHSYTYVLYVCLMCMPYVYALYGRSGVMLVKVFRIQGFSDTAGFGDKTDPYVRYVCVCVCVSVCVCLYGHISKTPRACAHAHAHTHTHTYTHTLQHTE